MRFCLADVDFFLVEALTETLGLGVVEGFVIGDLRKADGEGIVIVAIGLMEQSQSSKSECCCYFYREKSHAKEMINILCVFFFLGVVCVCALCAVGSRSGRGGESRSWRGGLGQRRRVDSTSKSASQH